jgi:hypothetical protein
MNETDNCVREWRMTKICDHDCGPQGMSSLQYE